MQQTQELSNLGWGIIGCANGYQHSSMGIDKHFNIAYNSLDLKGYVGEILPAPETRDLSPLFCLAQFESQGHKVMTLSEYHSIRQLGTNRTGTFLGAFVEVVNAQFSAASASALFSALKSLCGYQYNHFVEHSENRYNAEISNVAFDSPSQTLQQIGLQLQSWQSPVAKNKELYLSCESDGQFESLFALIIEENLLAEYSKIYFSANTAMTQGFKKSRIDVIEPSLSLGDQLLRQRMKKQIYQNYQLAQQYHEQLQNAKQQIAEIQANQSSIVAREVEQQAAVYLQREKEIKQQMSQLEIKTNAQALFQRLDALTHQIQQIENRVTHIGNNLNASHKLTPTLTPEPISNSNSALEWIAAILGVFSIIFLGTTIWFAVFSSPSDNEIKQSTVYRTLDNDLKAVKAELEKANKSPKIDPNAEFERGRQSLKNEVCENNPKDAKTIAISGNQQLCP